MADQIPNVNEAAQLAQILDLVKGKKSEGSSTQSSTTASNISAEGMQHLVNQILGGTQGLAAVASGQKAAGLYSSTVNQQLINDLISRTAGELESRRAGTTTTSTNRQVQQSKAPLDAKTILGLIANPLVQKGYKKGYKFLEDLFNEGSAAGGAVSLGGPTSLSQSVDMGGGAASFGGLDGGGSFGGSLSDAALGSAMGESTPTLRTGSVSVGPLTTGSSASSTSGVDAETLSTIFSSGQAASTLGGTAGSTLSSAGISGGGAAFGESALGASGAADLTIDPDAFSFASEASSAGDAVSAVSTGSDIIGGSGSTLGYLGSLSKAYTASQTDGDYREAVGSAILTYFGAGWATPIVSAIAEPLSDAALENGYDQNGVAGAFMNEPLGAIFSGDYEFKDIVSGTMDQANFFGGNEGGSLGGAIGQAVDPVGALFGGGVAGLFDDKVICTELNRQGKLSDFDYAVCGEYALGLDTSVRVGYHFWAIPVVRVMRNSPALSNFFLYLVNSRVDYLKNKPRFWGWASVKLGQPICSLIGKFLIAKQEVNYG